MTADDPHAVVLELYRLLSHSADSIIDRAAISTLLLPDARVRCVMANDAGVEDVGNWTVPEYLDLLAAALAWRIAGLASHTERARDPIPDGYLPENGVGSAGVSEGPGQTAA